MSPTEAKESEGCFAFGVSVGAGAAVDAFLNGVPVGSHAAGSAGFMSLPIQMDVVPGANRLEAVVGTSAIPPGAPGATPLPAPPNNLFAKLTLERDRVIAQDGDTITTTTDELEKQEWRPARTGEHVTLPHVMRMEFQAAASWTPPAWAGGMPMQASAIRPLLLVRLGELHDMLRRGDVAAFCARLRRRYADTARAYPLGGSAEEVRAIDAEGLERICRSSGFGMRNLDANSIQVRLYADGRLAEAQTPDGLPALAALTGAKQAVSLFKVLFSLIDGDLVVTR